MYVRRRLSLLFLCALFACASTRAATRGDSQKKKKDRRIKILNAMEKELKRSMNKLVLEGYKKPYFIAYRISQDHSIYATAKYGALHSFSDMNSGSAYVEVRVGDHKLDNMVDLDSGFDFSEFLDSDIFNTSAPLDDSIASLKRDLWLLTDHAYKKALVKYARVKAQRVYDSKVGERYAFSEEKPIVFIQPPIKTHLDPEKIKKIAVDLSSLFVGNNFVESSTVTVRGYKGSQYFVNFDNSRIITEYTLIQLSITATTQAKDGMYLNKSLTYYASDLEGLPDKNRLRHDIDRMVQKLKALADAPLMEPYSAPALILPRVSGVLFHEAVGHRLEGDRQYKKSEGRTFSGRLGEKVLPSYISVIDDPTLKEYNGHFLNGHYLFDEEGVRAQRVVLIDHGVLKSYLLSRTMVDKSLTHSNGHGRASGVHKPMARMGVTIVDIDKDHTLPLQELKKRLIELAKKKNKRYAFIIKDVSGGFTNTSSYGIQAYKGLINEVYRIDVRTGKEELVRGVEIVGTPLQSLNSVLYGSQEKEVFNGFCGAESGYVPVSTIAPALLLENIELQRKRIKKRRMPILKPPAVDSR